VIPPGADGEFVAHMEEVVTLRSEIAAWAARTNIKQRAVDWQFPIEKARMNLKRLYPRIQIARGIRSDLDRPPGTASRPITAALDRICDPRVRIVSLERLSLTDGSMSHIG
jgi:hypothetical protein